LGEFATVLRGEVKREWVDYNGHMGDYAYAIVFSDAVTAYMDVIGVDARYRAAEKATIYTLDMRIAFIKECHQGQKFEVLQQLLDVDNKRYHGFYKMIDTESGDDLAWCDQLLMHVQQTPSGSRSMPFPESVKRILDADMERQKAMAVPEWISTRIGIRRKS
jgi:acyl-CoA thioester hydrolase